jgi:fibronectin type 3 domain-containing protein
VRPARRTALSVTVLSLIGTFVVAVAAPAEASTRAFAPPLVLNDAGGVSTGGAEPSIEVDSHGQVYVSAPVGVPLSGCPFWEVDPDARAATYRGTIDIDHFGIGGGDCDISLSDNSAAGATHDVASVTSLSLANLTSNTTSDGGATFQAVANPASQQVFGVDRQWQVTDRALDRHYLTVHDMATVNIQTSVSIDGGYQYVQNAPAIDPTVVPTALSTSVTLKAIAGGNQFGTTVVDPTTHKLYIPFIAPAAFGGGANSVWVAEGDPCAVAPCLRGLPAGPIVWTNHLAYRAPDGLALDDGFPAIAIDGGGVVHVAWTGDSTKPATAGSGQDANRVFVIHSRPGDVSEGAWSAPLAVDTGTAYSNEFPWLVAGSAGNVGVAWYSSTLGTQCVGVAGATADVHDDCRNEWTVSYASSSDANSANPTWSVSQVSPGLVHRGSICTDGLNCAAGTRTLLDFFDVDLDAKGAPNFVFNSDMRAPGTADILYTRQCTGTTLTGVDLGTTCGGGGTSTPTGTPCPGGRAGFLDAEGDATEVLLTGPTPVPNDPAVDLLDGSVGWDAATSTAVLRARVADLTAPPTSGDGYYRWQVSFGSDTTAYQVTATVPADGSEPTYDLYDNSDTDVVAQALSGSVDTATGVVEIRLSSAKFQAAKPGNPALTGTTVLNVGAVLGQHATVAATITTDTATTVCSGTLAPPITPPAAPVLTGAAQGLTVDLSWSTPADGGAPITGYQVLRGTSASSLSPLANASGTTYADSTGTPGQTYFYAVKATNSAGTGAASNAVSATPVTTPGASALTATAGAGSVALSWSAPFDGGSSVTGYVVERGTTSGQRSTLTTLPAGSTSYTDSAVTAGTTYRYAVHATNAMGDGPSSSEVSATPYALPGAPTLLAVAGRGQVSLSWSTPSDGGRPIQGYRIYRGTSSGGEVLVQTITSGTSYIDGGLTGGTTYWYRVAAFTSAGPGAQSNEVSATPKKK